SVPTRITRRRTRSRMPASISRKRRSSSRGPKRSWPRTMLKGRIVQVASETVAVEHGAEHGAEHGHSILHHHFDDLEQQRECNSLGMWSFLATELMMFGGLFFAYTL